jgi:hypothetical protein
MRTLRVAAISIITTFLLLTSTVSVLSGDVEGRAPILSDGCGTTEVLAGRQSGAMEVGDLERSWVLDVPSGHDEETPLPLVILLHGGGMGPDYFIAMAGFGDLAEERASSSSRRVPATIPSAGCGSRTSSSSPRSSSRWPRISAST